MKIKPLDDNYVIYNTEGAVTNSNIASSGTTSSGSVIDTEMFGSMQISESTRNSEYENTEIYNKRARVELVAPVVNMFLAGSGYNVLKKILGEEGKNIEGIVEGNIIYSIRDNAVVKSSESSYNKDEYFSDGNFLLGGDYVRKLLEEMNIEDELKKCCLNVVNVAIRNIRRKDQKIYKELKDITFTTVLSGNVNVVEDFFIDVRPELQEILQEEVYKEVTKEMSLSLSRLALLLQIRYDRSSVLKQVMNYVIVSPIGLRPSFHKKKHRMTGAFNEVVRVNSDLRNCLLQKSATVETVRLKYIELVSKVRKVLIGEKVSHDKQYVSMADNLKGKKGFIRSRMLATRIDYSARSVIVVDPNMSLDTIGLPMSIAEKLYQLEALKRMSVRGSNKSTLLQHSHTEELRNEIRSFIEGEYAVIGRQPTLYLLGIQSFKIKLVEGNAIVLNPLSTPAFNADFDGDQMHVTIPVGDAAKEEVRYLLASTKNVFLPRNGDCHIAPRQEMMHGLWIAQTRDHGVEQSKKIEFNECTFLEDVINQRINIYDTTTFCGETMTVGRAAIRCCLPKDMWHFTLGVSPVDAVGAKEKIVKEDYFKELLQYIYEIDEQLFIQTTNRLVRLGFAITNIYPPTLQIVDSPDLSDIVSEFDESISDREELYNLGLETEKAFSSYYSAEYDTMESKIDKRLSQCDESNGFKQLSDSGARGNKSNLRQIFGMKGRVMKDSVEAFNAIIKHPLSESLSGLEHFITAYGAREGLMDKSVKTYKPGYIARMIAHTSEIVSITSDDCGTKDGLLLTFDFMKMFLDITASRADEVTQEATIRDMVAKMLQGRYIQGRSEIVSSYEDGVDVFKEKVAEVIDGVLYKKEGILLRSPVTCSNPCCVKCYGVNLMTNKEVIKGTAVGFIASQAIGEPGTQLTMKNFQSGGVAGGKNLTSSFDTVESYFKMVNLKAAGDRKKMPISYDLIAPVEGKVTTKSNGDGTKRVMIMVPNNSGELVNKLLSDINIGEDISLKEYVKVGDSIQLYPGNLDINEICSYRSVEEAKAYLSVFMYNLFAKEVYVNMKHFETVVCGMSFKLCIRGNAEYKAGVMYTLPEYYAGETRGCVFRDVLKGIKDVPKFRNDMFSGVLFENIQESFSRNMIMSGKDSMKNPITRYAFGLNLGIGSDVDGYIEERRNNV